MINPKEFRDRHTRDTIEKLAIIFRGDRSSYSSLGLYLGLMERLSNFPPYKPFKVKFDGLFAFYKKEHPELSSELTKEGRQILDNIDALNVICKNQSIDGLIELEKTYQEKKGTQPIEDAFHIGKGGQASVGYRFLPGAGLVVLKIPHESTDESNTRVMNEAEIQKEMYWEPYMLPAFGTVTVKEGEASKKCVLQPWLPADELRDMVRVQQRILYARSNGIAIKPNGGSVRLIDIFNFVNQSIVPIEYMNKKDYLIRDVNPRNIMCIKSEKGSVFFSMDPGSAVHKQDLSKAGFSFYMGFSPYEATLLNDDGGQNFHSFTSDIASYALIAHYMLTGAKYICRVPEYDKLIKNPNTAEAIRDVYSAFKKYYHKNKGGDLNDDVPYLSELIGGKDKVDKLGKALYGLFNPDIDKRGRVSNLLEIVQSAYKPLLKNNKHDLYYPLEWDMNAIKSNAPAEYASIQNDYIASVLEPIPLDASSLESDMRVERRRTKRPEFVPEDSAVKKAEEGQERKYENTI